jgi:N-methylhydantoinase B
VALGSGPSLKGKGKQVVPAGDSLVLELPGGGGLGDPQDRAEELVVDERRKGLVLE